MFDVKEVYDFSLRDADFNEVLKIFHESSSSFHFVRH